MVLTADSGAGVLVEYEGRDDGVTFPSGGHDHSLVIQHLQLEVHVLLGGLHL